MFNPGLKIGQIIKNADIVGIFKCGNMGGMRRSRTTNTLVIVSDYTKGLYHDKWIGGVLHYTGMGKSGDQDIRVFESANILLYLAEKYGQLLPTDPAKRTEVLNWLFWQTGAAPFLGGGFGHFFHYVPEKIEYAINRFAMEAKRQLDLLDKELANKPYIAGDDYTIADFAIWSWYGRLAQDKVWDRAGIFLDVKEYKHLQAWTEKITNRPAVKRGLEVDYKEINA